MGQVLRQKKAQDDTLTDDGFSLLEIVVAVTIVLVLSVVGFIAYQGITDNARQAAVEQAAHDVFTAALATDVTPITATTTPADTPGGVQLASHTVSTTVHTSQAETYARLRDIEQDYNDSSNDDIHVNIDKYDGELTVTALGWENQYTAMRSTDASMDGVIETPRGEDIDDTTGGVFRFTTGAPHSSVYLSDFGDGGVTLQIGAEDEKPIQEGDIALPVRGEYTVRGQFGSMGDVDTTTDIIEISIWENTNTVDTSYAFDGTRSNIIFHDTPPTTVTNMYNMFNDAVRFDYDVSDWDMTNVESTRAMFHGASSFNNGGKPLDWGDQFGNVVDMASMFDDTDNFNQDVSGWDVSSVENAAQMFNNALAFNNGGKPLDWGGKTANFTNTSRTFYNTPKFNQDISNWDVSNVVNMRQMFRHATVFNNGGEPLSWDSKTRNVTDMSYMFTEAASFNQDLTSWDVSSVGGNYFSFSSGSGLEDHYRPNF